MNFFSSSLFLLVITAATYQFGTWFYERTGRFALFQPVVIAIGLVFCLIKILDISYVNYRSGTEILPAMLGPAVVALAVPLYDSLPKVRAAFWPIAGTLLFGGVGVIFIGYLIGLYFDLDPQMNRSLLTRSMTAPIALSVADKIGGDASLTILGVFISGIVGTIITPFILKLLRVESELVRGFTLGFTSHAFGIARALQISAEASAFATIGMGLMGCVGAIVLPLIF